ncbi:MAG: PAS domain S-box protein [Planctomycetes bacterium]|nr:PAS domain S-box protein [Planctomycetota bacterium]
MIEHLESPGDKLVDYENWKAIMLNTLKYQIYIVSPEYDFIWVNKAFEEEIGLSLSELKGKKCYEVIHRANKPSEICLLYNMLKDNKFRLMETEVELNGKTSHISATPVLDGKGNLEKVIHILTDISEHKRAEESLLLSRNQMEAVAKIGITVNSTLNISEVLNYILTGALEVTGASVGMIFLKDQETGCLKWGAAHGLSEAFIQSYRDQVIKPGEGLSGRIAQTGQPIYIAENSSLDPRIARSIIKTAGFNSFIGVPVYAEDKIVAVMNVLTKPPDVLGEDKTALIKAVATQVGFAIRNARLFNERQKAEEALQRSERNLVEAQHIAHIGSYEYDVVNKRLYWSDEILHILGISRRDFKGNIDDFLSRNHPDDNELVKKAVKEAMEQRKAGDFIHRVIRADGAVRTVHERISPFFDEKGQVIRYIGAVHDITERKQAEEALKKSEEKFRMLAEKAIVGIYIIQDMKMVYINPSCVRALGYESGEAADRLGLQDIIHPDDFRLARQRVQERLEGKEGKANAIYRAVRKDGSTIDIEVYSMLTEYQGRPAVMGTVMDITERKRAEEMLKESENRFRQIAESSEEWIWEVDNKGLYTYASPVVEKILGYTPEEIVGKKHFYDLFIPDMREKLKKAAFEGFDKKMPFKEFVNPNEHKDGRIIILETNGMPILDSMGNLLGYRGADINITERRKMQEMLVESEEKYRTMVENSNDLIWALDVEGRLIFVNKRALEIGGYLMAELDKKHFSLGVHPDDLDRVKMHVGRTLKGESQTYEARVIDRHDRILVLQINAAPLYRNKQVIGTVSFARDITESKKAEEALRESEEKFRGLADQSPNMIFINSRGRVIYVNKKCEEIMGYSRKEFYSEKFDFMDIIAPDSRKLIKDNLKKHLKGKEIPPYEYKLRTKDGKEIVGIHTTKLIDIKGERAVLGIITDITEQVQSREQIRAQAVSLEQKNAALKELLEQITREKKDITDKMHTNLEKLVIPKIKRMKSKSEEGLKDQLGIIERHIKNIASSFGKKISSGQRALSTREIEICDMIRDGLKNKAIARELRLSLETVETMRKNIRRKLKIQNKEVNLKTYLQTL